MTFDEWFDSKRLPLPSDVIGLMRTAWDSATKIEREACAQVVEGNAITMDGREAIRNAGGSFYKGSPMFYATYALSAAIRARGKSD